MLAVILKPFIYALAIIGTVSLGWFGVSSWRQGNTDSAKVVTVGSALLEQIKHTQELTLVKHYQTVEVKYEEAPQGWASWLKDIGVSQSYTLLISGKVSAGIDLTGLQASDLIWVSRDNKHVQITLPAPRIFEDSVTIDEQRSRFLDYYDKCPALFCNSTDLKSYKDFVAPEARKRLIAAATEAGILEQAAKDAEKYYTDLFKAFPGVDEVRVVVHGYAPQH